MSIADRTLLRRIAERIKSAPALAEADRRFLRDLRADLVAQWGQTRCKMALAVVQGDAHNHNLARTSDGRIVFVTGSGSASGNRSETGP
ncbi:MAG: hypothetical protein ACRDQ4_10890 [Pseudonocardiaceae bacterium]